MVGLASRAAEKVRPAWSRKGGGGEEEEGEGLNGGDRWARQESRL